MICRPLPSLSRSRRLGDSQLLIIIVVAMAVRILCLAGSEELGVVVAGSQEETRGAIEALLAPRRRLVDMSLDLGGDDSFFMAQEEAVAFCTVEECIVACCICLHAAEPETSLLCGGGEPRHRICDGCLDRYCQSGVSGVSVDAVPCPGGSGGCRFILTDVLKRAGANACRSLLQAVGRAAVAVEASNFAAREAAAAAVRQTCPLADARGKVEAALTLGLLCWVCPGCGHSGSVMEEDCMHVTCTQCSLASCFACSRRRGVLGGECRGCDNPSIYLHLHPAYRGQSSLQARQAFQKAMQDFYVSELQRSQISPDTWAALAQRREDPMHEVLMSLSLSAATPPLIGGSLRWSDRETTWRRGMLRDALVKKGFAWNEVGEPREGTAGREAADGHGSSGSGAAMAVVILDDLDDDGASTTSSSTSTDSQWTAEFASELATSSQVPTVGGRRVIGGAPPQQPAARPFRFDRNVAGGMPRGRAALDSGSTEPLRQVPGGGMPSSGGALAPSPGVSAASAPRGPSAVPTAAAAAAASRVGTAAPLAPGGGTPLRPSTVPIGAALLHPAATPNGGVRGRATPPPPPDGLAAGASLPPPPRGCDGQREGSGVSTRGGAASWEERSRSVRRNPLPRHDQREEHRRRSRSERRRRRGHRGGRGGRSRQARNRSERRGRRERRNRRERRRRERSGSDAEPTGRAAAMRPALRDPLRGRDLTEGLHLRPLASEHL